VGQNNRLVKVRGEIGSLSEQTDFRRSPHPCYGIIPGRNAMLARTAVTADAQAV
jgi:hypothetical protein